MVLVVAEGDARWAPGLVSGWLAGIVPREGDGGGVLVQLGQVDAELADGAQHEGGQQAGAVGALQVVQGAAEAVVVEQSGLAGLKPQVFGGAAGRPGGDGVEWLAGQQEVGQEHAQGHGRGQRRLAAGQGRQVLLEQLPQLQPAYEAGHYGCGAHFQGFQGRLLPGQGHACLRGRTRACRLLW